ncbi:uncharacterized protein LOC111274197 [Durio zibethinus]|uniref:Uncharacterized protein LOC111274197 n=1 Tax=Durio zibethinus TaxID=66656 RepID=A0A6P5WET9_DURZI|nr:uncharacterized protein LOC111274197 [Durio zibethinus]
MPRANLALIAPTALVLFMFLDTGIARKEGKRWTPSSCGTITNISSPFCLKDDSSSCGDHTYELACENNRTTFTTKYGKFYVEEISYDDQKIRLVDDGLEKDKCSIPRNSLILYKIYRGIFLSFCFHRSLSYIYFLNCKVPINSSIYIDASPCTNSSSSPNPHFFYAILSYEADMKFSDFNESCKVEVQVPAPLGLFLNINSTSIFDIYNELSRGMEVCWQSTSNGLFSSFIYRIYHWWYLIVYEYLHLGIILSGGWLLSGEITYYVLRIPIESGKFQDVYRLISENQSPLFLTV